MSRTLLLALLLLPAFAATASAGEELPVEAAPIVFVIDVSCSMGWDSQSYTALDGATRTGTRMDRAKAEVTRSILAVPPGTPFDIVTWIGGPWAWADELVPATTQNKLEAVAFVNSLQPTGATGTGPATAWALMNSAYASVMSYTLITDGAPNCLDSGYSWSDWQVHAGIIGDANTKGATVNPVILIEPDYIDMQSFGTGVASQNGGQLTVVP